MSAIVFRVLRRRQFVAIIVFNILLGVSSLITSDIIGNFPQNNYFGYPVSVYSMQMLVTSLPTMVIFKFLFPLIASIATGDIIAEDMNSGYIKSFVAHSSLKKYLANNMLISFVVGGLVSIIPVIVNFLSLLFFVPATPLNQFYSMFLVSADEFMPAIYYNHPFIYLLIRILLIFLFGGGIALLASSLAFLLKNRYLAIAAPMFILMIIDMSIRFISLEQYTITSQFIGKESVVVTGGLFLIAIFMLAFMVTFYGVKKHEL